MPLPTLINFNVDTEDPILRGRPSREFQGIYHRGKNTLLGVKKSQDPKANEPLLYFTYSDLFKIGVDLHERLFHSKADYLNDFTKPDLDESTIFISSIKHRSRYNEIQVDYQKDELDLNMFNPIIAVRYKYNYEDSICFTLFINYQHYYLPISSHTIDKNLKSKLVRNNPNSIRNRYLELKDFVLQRVFNEFDSDYKKFRNIYTKSSRMILTTNYFVPIMLDIWNINRSVTSVKNDRNLKRKLNKRFNRALAFESAHPGIASYRSILQCLVEEKQYVPGNPSKPALSVSEQYIKCLSIFDSTPNDLRDYQDEQRVKYDELENEGLL